MGKNRKARTAEEMSKLTGTDVALLRRIVWKHNRNKLAARMDETEAMDSDEFVPLDE